MTTIFRNPIDPKPDVLGQRLQSKHLTLITKMSLSGLSVSNILIFIQVILATLQTIPVIGGDAMLVSALIALYQKATAAYQDATGKPFDVSLIPLEDRV